MKNKKFSCLKIFVTISTVLLPAIVTFLLTQSYFTRNVRYQIRIEAQKEMAISQIEVFNALELIKEVSTLFPFRYKSYVGSSHSIISVDRFGNQINTRNEKDSTSLVLTDTIYKVPQFVCTITLSKDFKRCMDIVQKNSMRLTPKACRSCNRFIAFVDSHPLPAESDISAKTVIESGWTVQETWETYYRLLDELYNTLKEDMKAFDFDE